MPKFMRYMIIFIGAAIIFLPLLYLYLQFIHTDNIKEELLSLVSTRRLTLLKNTLLLSLGSAATSVLVAIFISFIIVKTNCPYRKIIEKLFIVPFFIPPYLQAVVWVRLFSHFEIYEHYGINLNSLTGGIFIHFCSMLPLAILIISLGMKSLSKSMEEAALLVLSPTQCLFKIVLPQVLPFITVAFLLIFILTLNNFEVADSLRLTTYPMEIFISYSALYDEQQALFLSLPLIAVSFVAIFFMITLIGRQDYAMFRSKEPKVYVYLLSKFRFVILVPTVSLLVLLVVVPIVSMVNFSLDFTTAIQVIRQSLPMIKHTIGTSLMTAITVTTLSCALCYEFFLSSRGRFLKELSLAIPYGVPSITYGIAIITLFNQPWLNSIYNSSAILVIGGLVTLTPFIVQLLKPSFMRVTPSSIEMARFSHAIWFKRIFLIILPMYFPAFRLGVSVCFVMFLSCLGVTLLIIPAGSGTLPISIYNYMHYGSEQAVHTLGLVLLLIMSVVILPLTFIRHRGEHATDN